MNRITRPVLWIASAITLSLVFACQSSSPTETSLPQPHFDAFNVSVSASPSTLTAGGSASSIVTIGVRRADNNQPPTDGTVVSVVTSLGWFGSLGNVETTVAVALVNGQAQFAFFPGMSPGTAIIQAFFAGSAGQAWVSIL